MKSIYVYISLLAVAGLFSGCVKNGGTNKPNPAGKAWLVKDISFPAQCGGGVNNFEHLIFTYDNDGKIIRFTDSACAASSSTHFEIIYNSQGKITQINGFQGIYQIMTWTITYNSTGEFVAKVTPTDTAHNAITRWSWNLNNNKELDEWVEQGNPLIIGLPYDIYHDYSYTSGGLHGEDGHTGGPNPTPVQTLWTLYSEGTGASIQNPFHVGRTPEQIFLYIFFGRGIGDWNLLGNSLSNGVYEAYSYSTGSKNTISHFYYNYALDSNNNVSKITEFGAQDAPNFGTFVSGAPWNITYEQH